MAKTTAGYRRGLLLMLAPAALGATILIAGPALLSLGLAFTHYDLLGPPRPAGLANLRALAADPLAWMAARNTLLVAFLAAPMRVLGALAIALLLAPPRPGAAGLRAVVFLPAVVPEVATALLWLWILNPQYRPLNVLLGALGLPAPAWLAEPTSARLAFVLLATSQLGEGMVVLLAGLRAIPAELRAAAAVDGAGPLVTFRWITLPLLAPWLLLLAARDLILATQQTLAPALLMTRGGPYYATYFVPQLIYELAFDRLRYGLAAAVMLLTIMGSGLLIALVVWAVRGWGYDEALP